MNATSDLGSLEYASASGFAATVEHLTAAIKAAGMSIFAQIDHAAGARQVGLTMPPADRRSMDLRCEPNFANCKSACGRFRIAQRLPEKSKRNNTIK